MKKFLLGAFLAAFALLVFPSKTQAQYTSPYIYNNNAYLNYAIASSKARATRNRGKKKAARRRARRRVVHRRRAGQTSLLENSIMPKYKTGADLPKQIYVG